MASFLSYSSANSDWADLLEARLRSAGVVLYRDRAQMRGGGNWKEELLPLIDHSEQFVLLWSRHAAKSRHVAAELGRAIVSNIRIIPIVLDDSTVPASLEDHHVFRLVEDSDVEPIVQALAPGRGAWTQADAHAYRAALASFRSRMNDRLSVFQILYPGEVRSVESIIPLRLVDGMDSASAPSVDSGTTIADLFRSRDARQQKLLLAGQPGAGKSTTLQYLAYASSTLVPPPMPLLVRCADFRPDRHVGFEEFVLDGIRLEASREILEVLRRHDILHRSEVMILLDGLDELPAGTDAMFHRLLDEYLDSPNASCKWLLASGRLDYLRLYDERFSEWQRYTLLPLDGDQIKQFVRAWFDADAPATGLIQTIAQLRNPELASRPFLLAMMCLVYQRGGDLGRNRSDLYAKAIHYLEYRRATTTSQRTIELRHRILCELAFRSLQMGAIELDRKVAAGFAASCMDELGHQRPDGLREVEDYLDGCARDVGILQSSVGRYSFVHRTFQEYLAAQRMINSTEGDGLMVEHARIHRWEEPIRLYIGALEDPKRQGATLMRLWTANQALTLRALVDATRVPANFVQHLLNTGSAADRVRMLQSMPESLVDVDEEQRRPVVLETVSPLIASEADSRVLYHAVELVRAVDPEDETRTLWNAFGARARRLRESLLLDPRFRFEFVTIASGSFLMGDDSGLDEIEKPAHLVHVSGFDIGRFQVTNLAYEFINSRPPGQRHSVSTADDQPVVDVSWFDAYMTALRVGCRLPTEAEWEYAARAGSASNWCFGDDQRELYRYAAYEDNPNCRARPWAVGSGLANRWGLYDVHGNVWEWCVDWLGRYSASTAMDPTGPSEGAGRVRRGGGHSYHARGCRSAYRWANDPSYSFRDIGLRLVLDPAALARGW